MSAITPTPDPDATQHEPLVVTIFADRAARTKREEQLSLEELAHHIGDTRAPAKSKLPLLKLGRFGDQPTTKGSLRSNANMQAATGLEGDYDAGKISIEEAAAKLQGIRALLYTTTSHTPQAPRWRVLCPFSREYPCEHRNAFLDRLNALLGGILARESKVLSQAFYYGAVDGHAAPYIVLLDGAPIDLHDADGGAAEGADARGGSPARGLGQRPEHITGGDLHLNAAAQAGVRSFANLPAEKQNAMLVAMLEIPAIKALADAPRAEWLRLLFALAAAGAKEARVLALDWSRSSKRFKSEADFDRDWNSFDPARPAGITVATLIALARDAGFDLGAWLDAGDPGNAAPASTWAPLVPPPSTGVPPPAPASEPEADAVIHMPIRFSENALAYLFTNEHADNLLYVHLWGTWLFWRAGRWCVDHAVKVFDASRAICAREGKIAETTLTNGRAASTQINKASTVAAIERLARHHHQHVREVDAFDADPMLLNTPDNTIDLRDPRAPGRPHQREHYLTRTTAVTAAATAGCPLWKAFLLRIVDNDQDMVDYLQRVCGYMLTGSVKEHALFFGYGTGANGKGTFAGVLLGILNADQIGYAAVAAISTFTASYTEQHPTDLAMLRGKRLVVAQETEAGRSWAIAKIKMMTGGDMITARFMRQDFFTYPPQFKLMIMGNHKPSLGSVDEATRRRFHLIPFTVEIPVGERDRELGGKLKAEYPQILRWMLEGCAAWQREGLKPPKKVLAATEAYLGNEDTFGIWLEECCELGKDYITRQSELFGSWKNWSWNNGEPEARRKTLTNGLDGHSAFSRSRDTDNQIVWKGLKLRPGGGTLLPSPAARAKSDDYKEIDDLLRN